MQKTLLTTALLGACALAWANPEPVEFYPEINDHYGDWSLTCDNRGTCRAVGYHSDDTPVFEENSDFYPVSMKIEREAGKKEVVALLGFVADDAQDSAIPEGSKIEFFLDDKSLGNLQSAAEAKAKLSAEQLSALVAKAPKGKIEFRADKFHWLLSDVGMQEVLKKMDEVQGFAGTSAAFFNQGDAPLPTQTFDYPQIDDKAFLDKEAREIKISSDEGQRLLKLLSTVKDSDGELAATGCDVFDEKVREQNEQAGFGMTENFSVWRLNEHKSLLTASCFHGAYNSSSAAWIMDDKLSKVDSFLSSEITDVADSRLYQDFKGRGLGDCFDLKEYVWDGEQFVMSFDASTGACKGFAGGAWTLPRQVIQPKNSKAYEID